MTLTADFPIIDTDSHVIEPPDLWTARLPRKWQQDAPRVVWDETTEEFRWRIGDAWDSPVALLAAAGYAEHWPKHPHVLEDADPASFDPQQRLKKLDEWGIKAQVLYPNLLAFSAPKFMRLEPDFALECVRAYNDWQNEFAEADPKRLLPLTVVPFWNLDAAITEITRCREQGHKGVLLGAIFEQIGMPNLDDPHWSPLLNTIQDLGMSINMHVAFAAVGTDPSANDKTVEQLLKEKDPTRFAEVSVTGLMGNVRAITTIAMRGVCHNYPGINFVSVESGAGYLPYVLQAMDWQYENTGSHQAHPDWLLPSEYFRRQIFGTFWFEKPATETLIDLQDNLMFETDFPHPTSLSPGPASTALYPREAVQENLGHLDEAVIRKLIHDNAAKLYGLD